MPSSQWGPCKIRANPIRRPPPKSFRRAMRRLSADLRRGKILLDFLAPLPHPQRHERQKRDPCCQRGLLCGLCDGRCRRNGAPLGGRRQRLLHSSRMAAIVGRLAVIGSWSDILGSADRPQITCHDPYAIVTGDSGCVLCVELMGSVALAASNHFRLVNGEWRLSHHQSSPIGLSASQSTGDPSSAPSGRIH